MSLIPRLILIALLVPVAATAQDTYVPEELRDWQEWVLKDKEYRNCPFYFDRGANQPGDFICAWPGPLELAVDKDAGRFTQQWTVYADEQWLTLPGDTAHWPHNVTVNGRSVSVVARNSLPSVYLGPGAYRVTGSFEWTERPGVLQVPDRAGLITLRVNGQSVSRPERTGNGVFLGERERATKSRDTIETQVYRLVADNVPTRLVTQLRINISGSVREELLGPLLPDGFVPLSIRSPLPARLEPDGNLLLQVRPGSWVIEVSARAPAVLNAVPMPGDTRNLPASEIWSYRSNDLLRVTAAEGLPPVDPGQANVPGGWQQLPAFRATVGGTLTIIERSRGLVAADNDLSLARQMWLDFGGDGFVVSDNIAGTMRTGWRLDMAPPYTLLSASDHADDLLITRGQEEGQTGVELRHSNVNVESLGRAETRGRLPVAGWAARFADISTLVHLPPGNKLLAAPGADNAPASWVSRWQLLDFFLVLIITIGSWRLFGRTAGLIALAALTLSFHEINAPSWLWLNVLIAIALMRVAPPGRLRQSVGVYQAASAVILVLALVPFLASQLRIAIYPQLEPQYDAPRSRALTLPMPAAAQLEEFSDSQLLKQPSDRESDAMKPRRSELAAIEPRSSLEEGVVAGGAIAGYVYSRYAPNALVQAGPGKPSWRWNSYLLSWSGPIDAGQELRLVILPRWAVSLLRFVEVLMLLLFTAVLAAEILQRRFTLPGGLRVGSSPAVAVLAASLLLGSIGVGTDVHAQTPNPELLKELETRLLEAPDCVPRCAEIVAASIDVGADNVRMELSVHALQDVAMPLPGSERGWRPTAILLDGGALGQVAREHNGTLQARLQAGRHTVILSGPVPAVDSLEIPFPAPPRFVEVDSDGWFVAGIKDRRLLSGSLQLTRLQRNGAAEASARWESSRFPAFVEITRTIHLDLDWAVQTTVRRITPAKGALTLELPLVEDESVLTEGVTVKDKRALVTMNPNQAVVSWHSKLPRKSPLTINAEADAAWQEVWRVGYGSTWHATFSGVPESGRDLGDGQARIAEFFPRGGEHLQIDALRPEAAAGSTLAFDAVQMGVQLGHRSSTANLGLNYRSTQGEQHTLALPAAAEVTQVLIDGRIEPLRADAGQLTVPILPGEHHIQVSWREANGVSTRVASPLVDIGAPASNISLSLELPENRWLLATNGPRLGPAVLYWSELAVLLLFAAILGRIRLTPLTTRHWLLLGLGFSTFSWPVLGIVVVWLLACGARERWDGKAAWWRFDLVQIAIAAATVVALSAIVGSLPSGLLGTPDMHVTGNNSYGNSLSWFADSSESVLPAVAAWSLPMWTYKALILAWALWLSFALLRWLPWVWKCFSAQGYWRSRRAALLGGSKGGE